MDKTVQSFIISYIPKPSMCFMKIRHYCGKEIMKTKSLDQPNKKKEFNKCSLPWVRLLLWFTKRKNCKHKKENNLHWLLMMTDKFLRFVFAWGRRVGVRKTIHLSWSSDILSSSSDIILQVGKTVSKAATLKGILQWEKCFIATFSKMLAVMWIFNR